MKKLSLAAPWKRLVATVNSRWPSIHSTAKRRSHRAPFLLLVIAFLLSPLRTEAWQIVSAEHPAMGTMFRIELYATDPTAAEKASQLAFERIDQLEKTCSDYRPDSELTALNRSTEHHASADLFAVITRSQQISVISDGAFDITAGHLTNLWRRSKRKLALPTPEQLAKSRSLTDYRLIQLAPATRTVRLARPGMQLDLGGIAKGYAADEALKLLTQHGFPSAIVAASGDLAIGDAPPDQPQGWQIKVRTFEAPEATDRLLTLQLKNCGISTSGDIHQSVEINGQRYSHIVDPSTGLGLTRRISCSVIAQDATTSDANATAACILDPEKALKTLEGSLRLVTLTNGVSEVKTSPSWPR